MISLCFCLFSCFSLYASFPPSLNLDEYDVPLSMVGWCLSQLYRSISHQLQVVVVSDPRRIAYLCLEAHPALLELHFSRGDCHDDGRGTAVDCCSMRAERFVPVCADCYSAHFLFCVLSLPSLAHSFIHSLAVVSPEIRYVSCFLFGPFDRNSPLVFLFLCLSSLVIFVSVCACCC